MLFGKASYTRTRSFTFMALTISNFHCDRQFYAQRVTLNNGGSEKRRDLVGNFKVLELTETRVHSVSEADVVALEDFGGHCV